MMASFMAWHRQCAAKHQINAYLMVKVSGRTALTAASSPACRCQDGRAMAQAGCQSCHLHKLKVAEHTGIISEATRRAGTT